MDWEAFYSKQKHGVNELIGNLAVHRDFVRTIIEQVPVKNSESFYLLETGVGSGDMSIFFSLLGYNVTSIDNDPGVLANVKSRDLIKKAKSLKMLQQDAFDLSFKEKEFNLTFSQGFFEHFSDDDIVKLIAEQIRVSRKVVFSVPSFWYRRKDFGNERLLQLEDWQRILKNFNVTRSFYYSFARKRILVKPLQICIVIKE